MKKRLMTIFVIVAVLLTLLPATLVVNAADEWTNVSNFQQLKSALASTTVTKVRFTNNISVAKCGAVISEKKSSLVIDGNGYTLTDYYSNSANDTIRLVTAGKLINIDIQNMNIQGWNAYGPFYIRDACNIVGRNLYFDNVIYEGPQLAINHRGNVEIKDSDINLRQGYCKALGSVAACNNAYLKGKVTINKVSPSTADKALFYLLNYAWGGVYVEDGADVKVDNTAGGKCSTSAFMKTNVCYGHFTVGKNASFVYNGLGSFQVCQALQNVVVDESAYVYITTKGNFVSCGYGQMNLKGDMRVEQNATLRMVAESNNSATSLLQLCGSKTKVAFNNPKEVLLANSSKASYCGKPCYYLAIGTSGKCSDATIEMNSIKSLELWNTRTSYGGNLHDPITPTRDFRNNGNTAFDAKYRMYYSCGTKLSVTTNNYSGATPLNNSTGALLDVNILRINGGMPAPEYASITVKHVYEDGTDVIPPVVDTEYEPGAYNFDSIATNDLIFVGMGQGSSPATGTIAANEAIEIVFVYKDQEYFPLEGTVVWEGGNTLPPRVNVQLFQNGVPYIADQWFDTDRITVFGFDNLPKYAADGSEFVYTVDDPELHVGFVKTVDNSQYIIHQRYTTFLVRIYHKDQTTNEDLKIMEEQYVAYGDTITLYSANFTDKMLISEPTVVLNNVMAPADVTFWYV